MVGVTPPSEPLHPAAPFFFYSCRIPPFPHFFGNNSAWSRSVFVLAESVQSTDAEDVDRGVLVLHAIYRNAVAHVGLPHLLMLVQAVVHEDDYVVAAMWGK